MPVTVARTLELLHFTSQNKSQYLEMRHAIENLKSVQDSCCAPQAQQEEV